MTEKYPTGTRAESERLVREWGFRHIFTWTDGRYVQGCFFFCRDDTPKMGSTQFLNDRQQLGPSSASAYTDADLVHQQRLLFPALA